ncbi:Fructuronate reductase [Modestobacter italicus]|uniref:Fructuronate reductase n=1 Tax=Modestobacter italicus (strain DSM 44449 / CECT 9708 / BC 501) TaxID=2732864 RepID=I4EW66_MODI5|nr:mannitol dehydrogenase family protein [Modestobacter marinus]CCH87629.1 Fructuronate reductase [Modestobacter marinus]
MSSLRRGTAAPPVRMVHLGLGSFSRAHQAWYTDRAGDDWGIAAFTGRRPDLARALAAQDGLYTLVTRGAGGDEFSVVRSLVRAHAADEQDAWLRYLGSPDVRVVTVTVTEAGYGTAADGAPARLLAGLRARRAADAGPVTLVPCDNLPGNGAVLGAALQHLMAETDPAMADWLREQVSVATTVVDRITPAPTDDDRRAVLAGTGVDDRCPVATEPFSEWVLAGAFPGGRPAWETAGAVLTADVTPFEDRKLWLLNGAHSLLAYAGPLRGWTTVAEAVTDPVCAGWVQEWWDTCAPHLDLPVDDVARYRAALLARFADPRIRHSLAQIAADGSQKLPVRLLPVLRRDAGERPAAAARRPAPRGLAGAPRVWRQHPGAGRAGRRAATARRLGPARARGAGPGPRRRPRPGRRGR